MNLTMWPVRLLNEHSWLIRSFLNYLNSLKNICRSIECKEITWTINWRHNSSFFTGVIIWWKCQIHTTRRSNIKEFDTSNCQKLNNFQKWDTKSFCIVDAICTSKFNNCRNFKIMVVIWTCTTSFKKLAKLLGADINKFRLLCKSILVTWLIIYNEILKFEEYRGVCFRQQL